MKGQILSLDFMVAITIMLILVGSLSVMLWQYEIKNEQSQLNREITVQTQNAVDTLTQTKGTPETWETLT